MLTLAAILQIIVALGLLNVWLLRFNKNTNYRGGNAKNLKQEFTAYGLPSWFFGLIGTMKITIALALIVGIWLPRAAFISSILLCFLMLGAIAMHIKVGDAPKKSLPALLMLIMSALIVFTTRSY
jgi:hypothetical protein